MNLIQSVKSLLFPYYNCELITYKLCKQLKVPATKTNIQNELLSHPDYPSLLSVGDVLRNYGVDNIALKAELEQFTGFPIPLVAQVSLEKADFGPVYFTLVTNYVNDMVTFFHPTELKEVTMKAGDFRNIFTGYTLLAEANERSGEKDYSENLKKENSSFVMKLIYTFAIPLITVFVCAVVFIKSPEHALYPVIYTMLTMAGAMVGALLIWYDVDRHNPALKQICSAGKKTNCNAILNSSASKIFGVSWSAIGFSYFTGSLIALVASGLLAPQILFLISFINILALPYTVFSIYYQSRIAKQWCTMCLCVQALLVLQFITALGGKFHSKFTISDITVYDVFVLIISFTVPFLFVNMLIPALQKGKENKNNKRELLRIMHNPQIFEALLAKQKEITETTEGLGILLGNADATNKLVKVCNPYCSHCSTAHLVLDDLLESNKDLQVQIIFTATDDEEDERFAPASHLMAISGNGNELETKQALDNWYIPEEKNYTAFAQKHPIKDNLVSHRNKVKAMDEWCRKTEISFTPTFFLNGHQLPEIYSYNDLKYFLSV